MAIIKSEQTKAKKQNKILALLILLGVLIVLFTLKYINPSEVVLLPCWMHELTGILCPGCGLTRATYSILNLNFKEAFSYNALSFVVMPLLGVIVIGYIYYLFTGKKLIVNIKKRYYISAVIIVLAFTIYRNIH